MEINVSRTKNTLGPVVNTLVGIPIMEEKPKIVSIPLNVNLPRRKRTWVRSSLQRDEQKKHMILRHMGLVRLELCMIINNLGRMMFHMYLSRIILSIPRSSLLSLRVFE